MDILTKEIHDEAIAEAKAARKLDPLSLIINSAVGRVYMFARRFDEAIESLLLTLEIDPKPIIFFFKILAEIKSFSNFF